MTPAQQIQEALYLAASTISLWRDLAIAGLAIAVVGLLYLAASAR
jgi:hypothetical protein